MTNVGSKQGTRNLIVATVVGENMLTPTQFQQRPATPPVAAPPGMPEQGGTFVAPPAFDSYEAIQVLAQQVAALRAQQRVMVAQTRSNDPGVAAAARAGLPAVESQLARATIDLAMQNARYNARQTRPGFSDNFNRGPDRSRPNADQMTIMTLAFIFAVMMPIAIAMSRRIFRKGSTRAAQAPVDVISPRLDRLEQAVDAVAIEVERISEGQRFVTKVLVERPAAARAATVRQAGVPETNDASGLNDPKPFLALGAGPIEPVRVAERQAVRQSITPH